MPNLGPIVNLTDDIDAQMRLSSNIGSGLGSVVAAQKIKQQEEKEQFAQQNHIAMMNRAVQEDWDPPRIIDEMAKNKVYTETEWGRRQVMKQQEAAMQQQQSRRAAQQPVPDGTVVTSAEYDEFGYLQRKFGQPRAETATSQEIGLLTPEEQRQRALIKSGIAPRAAAERPASVTQQKWDLLSDEDKEFAAKISAGIEPRVVAERPPSVTEEKWNLLSDEDKDRAAKIFAGIEPRATNNQTPDDIKKEYDDAKKRYDMATDDEEQALLKKELDNLRVKRFGKSAVDAENKTATLSKIRQEDTLEKMLVGLPQNTNRPGAKLDETKDPERIRENMVAYANKLVQEYGFTQEEAIRETQDQYASILAGDNKSWQVYPRGVELPSQPQSPQATPSIPKLSTGGADDSNLSIEQLSKKYNIEDRWSGRDFHKGVPYSEDFIRQEILSEADVAPEDEIHLRPDGTKTGPGWLGVQKGKGGLNTEGSIGITVDGKSVEIPLFVPGLTSEELGYLNNTYEGDWSLDNELFKSALNKAKKHAMQRIRNGQSPFKEGPPYTTNSGKLTNTDVPEKKPTPQQSPITAVNKKTGQRIVSYDGGQTWQPLQ